MSVGPTHRLTWRFHGYKFRESQTCFTFSTNYVILLCAHCVPPAHAVVTNSVSLRTKYPAVIIVVLVVMLVVVLIFVLMNIKAELVLCDASSAQGDLYIYWTRCTFIPCTLFFSLDIFYLVQPSCHLVFGRSIHVTMCKQAHATPQPCGSTTGCTTSKPVVSVFNALCSFCFKYILPCSTILTFSFWQVNSCHHVQASSCDTTTLWFQNHVYDIIARSARVTRGRAQRPLQNSFAAMVCINLIFLHAPHASIAKNALGQEQQASHD